MHDLDDYEEDDGFGPGSDLVLSLLAIAILLLGITGASRQISLKKDWTQTAPETASPEKLAAELLAEQTKAAELARSLEAVTQDAAAARAQLQTAQAEKEAVDAGLKKMAEHLAQTEQKSGAVTTSEKLVAEALAARTKAAELERALEGMSRDVTTARAQLQRTQTDKAVMEARLEEMVKRLAQTEQTFSNAPSSEKLGAEALAARTRAAELARSLESVTQDATVARAQLQTMKTEKEAMDSRLREMTKQLLLAEQKFAEAEKRLLGGLDTAPGVKAERVIAFRLSERSVSFFSSGSAELREPIQQLLAGQFQSIRRMTLEHGANHLEIVGYASPEASMRNDQDSNLDLSTQRAIAVTHFLGAKGVPYHCMSAVGMGRGRSDIISTLASTLASGTGQAEATRKWDELTRSAKGPAFTARLTNDLAEERRVEVVLTRDHASKCTQDELVAALNR